MSIEISIIFTLLIISDKHLHNFCNGRLSVFKWKRVCFVRSPNGIERLWRKFNDLDCWLCPHYKQYLMFKASGLSCHYNMFAKVNHLWLNTCFVHDIFIKFIGNNPIFIFQLIFLFSFENSAINCMRFDILHARLSVWSTLYYKCGWWIDFLMVNFYRMVYV